MSTHKPVIINSPSELGRQVRAKRKKNNLTQAQAAAFCKVGTRFLSDLENGKKTLQIGKVMTVLKALGLVLSLDERGWPST